MPHISKLHSTTLDKRSKARRKRKLATGSEHLLVGMKIAIPVLPSIGAYISNDARSCVNDDYFDLPSFSNRKFQSEKKSPIQGVQECSIPCFKNILKISNQQCAYYNTCKRMFDMFSSFCENFIFISLSIAMWHCIFHNWRINKLSFQRKRSIP